MISYMNYFKLNTFEFFILNKNDRYKKLSLKYFIKKTNFLFKIFNIFNLILENRIIFFFKMQPMRVIQNTDLIKDRVRECMKLTEDDESSKSRFENELNEEYLTLDFIKFLKTFWNKNSKGEQINI